VAGPGGRLAPLYLDACATSPPAPEVLEAMAAVHAEAWANPSSLHGFGLAAAEALERARLTCASCLGCSPTEVVFTSGGTESIHLALLGSGAVLPQGRLLLSRIEHPATEAAALRLMEQGWQRLHLPVDRQGHLDLEALEGALEPPTRLMSVIWGQSEVGTLQDLTAIGERCRKAGVLLHVDAVQVVGHCPVNIADLPVDLLSLAGHKLQGPRGVGALVVREGTPLHGLLGGGGQEAGRRAGTEPVALAVGLARALELATTRLALHGGHDPLADLRNQLLESLLKRPGLTLTGPDPRWDSHCRLPHHLSLLVASSTGESLSGRALVRALWQEGIAASSGSACSSRTSAASPVLLALGYGPPQAGSGLRLSLGPWIEADQLPRVTDAFERARQRISAGS
jgi:cysteine desulfurase